MQPNLITYAIPGFILLILVEVAVNRLKKKDFYNYHDSVNDLSAGIFSQVSAIFGRFLLFGIYIWVYQNYRIFDISNSSVLAWIACFFLVDMAYYWFHRASHECAMIWGSHLPHHQSEEYNLTVALRQGAFQGYFSLWFYLPIAWLGFPPYMFLVHSQLNTIYQFWIHTRAINKLGFLETFLNTPSHHRVHHGKNPIYIDKNYAGTLIIWDKIFGSFEPESEEVVYGTMKPLASWNPIYAQVHYFGELFMKSVRAPGLLNKFKVLFKGPGWIPPGVVPDAYLADPAYTPEGMKKGLPAHYPPKYRTKLTPALNLYTFIQFVVALTLSSLFFAVAPQMTLLPQILASVWIVASLTILGGIFENRRWAHILEIHRMFATAIAVFLLFPEFGALYAAVPVLFAAFFFTQTLGEAKTA
jgi:alkylglycerol monooxygenase